MVLLHDVIQVFDLPQPRETSWFTTVLHRCDGFQIGRVLVHGDRARFTVCSWAIALRKNRLAADTSRLAESRNSIVWPWLSIA
jgi:hypothetical protein